MAEFELWMERRHISERGEAFQHIGIIEHQVIHHPGGVEMSGNPFQGAVQVFDERRAPRLMARFSGHTEAELKGRHCSPNLRLITNPADTVRRNNWSGRLRRSS